jgi:predicted dithiol-disulfide oxidoreductase (DUF899 family)
VGWFAVIVVLSIFNTVLGEELLFRGLLLPRMNGVFGRFDWLANGVLFFGYHLHEPWVFLSPLADAVVLAYPTKRYRSAWIGIAVHSAQSSERGDHHHRSHARRVKRDSSRCISARIDRTCNEGEDEMTEHRTGTGEEWLAARRELLAAEKELTHQSDRLAEQRQQLPWVLIDKDYRFETDEGTASLADLFAGRSQLLIYHFMFGPEYTAGCPACSAIADGFNGSVVHLANHDVTLMAVSRAPLEKLQQYKRRMGWSFPWASSLDSDFNFDFDVSTTEEQQRQGLVEYNFDTRDVRPILEAADQGPLAEFAAMTGTDAATYLRESPGMSSFALEDSIVYHTYSAYARGMDVLWAMYQWLDRAPKGRNETGPWFRRHDEYGTD